MPSRKKKKIRAEFRKRHDQRRRQHDLTRRYLGDEEQAADLAGGERVSGKGDLTRKRTIVGNDAAGDEVGFAVQREVDARGGMAGRVLSIHGLATDVRGDDGRIYRCSVSGVLKSLDTDLRHVVAAGDRVFIRSARDGEGMIERVEPRRGVLSRASKGRRQILVANVQQVLIVASAALPDLKPHLIDRFIVAAEMHGIRPVVCINKADLVDIGRLVPLAGVFGQMGYAVVLCSVVSGLGVERLKSLVRGRQSVVAGQSGVGKSSLLNAIEPGLNLKIAEVSSENQKGKHTTTAARLIPLAAGGFVADTPGIRQFELWDVSPEEVAGYFRDLRPYVSRCRFPDCTHTHETDCAVKDAVADGRINARRYESYCHMFEGDAA